MRQFSPAIENVSVQSLKPYPRNARRHSKAQIKQIAASIERFGFSNPVLIADDGEIVAGHGRVAAAKLLGIEIVLAVRLSHLTEEERRAYVIADNKLALNAGWDREWNCHIIGWRARKTRISYLFKWQRRQSATCPLPKPETLDAFLLR